jgi:predicted Zn-dependent protease
MADPTAAPTRGRFARLRPLAAPFLWVGRWFYHAPRLVQVGLILVLLGGLATGGYFARGYLKKRTGEREAAAGWAAFEDAARKTDVDAMKAALDRVLAARPDEPTAARRRAALDAAAANDDDAELATVLVNYHTGGGRLSEAAREARKVIKKYPRDWRSLCVLAHEALQGGRPDECRKWLDALPAPDDPDARLDVGGVLYAVRLMDLVGRDAGPLRLLIVRRLLPVLRGKAAESAPPAAKAQFLECYLLPFADASETGELAAYWAVVARLHELAVAGAVEAGDVTTLVRLGSLAPRLSAALGMIREYELRSVPADPPERRAERVKELDARFAELAREVNDRTRRAWQAVREKEPTRHEAYLGLARVAAAERDVAGAAEALRQGLIACGGKVELLDPFIRLLSATGHAADALRIVWSEAEAAKTDPVKWCMAANAALAADRRNLALLACRNARTAAPDHPWACQTEARLLLENGEASAALELLLKLGDAALKADPLTARLHARAMIETGLSALRDSTLDELVAAAVGKQPAPVVPVAFLRGVMDARNPDTETERAAWVAARAQKLLADWPDDALARRLQADALYRQAELSDPPWPVETARAALRAYQGLPAADQSDVGVAASTAALYLKALKDAGGAGRAAAPLRDPAAAALLTPAQVETLAAVLITEGRPGDAIAVLGRVCVPPPTGQTIPGGTAGCWVQLARALHANRQRDQARAALDMVLNIPNRSAREHAEWVETKLLFQREMP